MGYNTTIRQKKGICPRCGGRDIVPLIGKYCQQHYWEENKKKSVEKLNAKERGELPAVAILSDDMDIIFSKLIRLKDADENGLVQCFTCPTIRPWTQMQCGHFVKRGNMATRFSEKNCRPQCKECNEHKDGNEKVFAERLEAEEKGLVEMLREQGREVEDYSRDELKLLIQDTTRRVKLLLKNIYQ
jgi:NinG protein